MAQADVDDSGNDARLTSAEKKELGQLRRANRMLELENEILKRGRLHRRPRPFPAPRRHASGPGQTEL